MARPYQPRVTLLAVALLGAGASAPLGAQVPPAARAQAPSAATDVVGNVIAIDAGDLVVDVGSSKGATEGDEIELWRPLKLRHPVTGQTLTDRFRIGELRLVQVRQNLALARQEGKPARDPAVGDVVILVRSPGQVRRESGSTTPRATPREAPVPGERSAPGPVEAPDTGTRAPETRSGAAGAQAPEGAPSKGGDQEARELSAIFDALQGSDPATRIGRYERYVRAHPTGRFARVLYEEAQALRLLFSQRARAEAEAGIGLLSFAPPRAVLAGSPLELTAEVSGPAVGAVLHFRHQGEVAYVSTPMSVVGPGYFTAIVPAERVVAPGAEYFFEAVDPRGAAVALTGTAEVPLKVVVHPVPVPTPPRRGDATLSLVTDYADYNRLRGNDWASQTEGYFGLRFDEVGVRAVRSGFGVYRGVGGTLHDLDDPAHNVSPRLVGLTYGYLEGEFGVSTSVSLLGRAVMGLGDDGVTGGGQLLLRLGNDKATNLLLGGEFLGGVGLRSITQLEWNTIPRFPIVLRTEVSNQPAGTRTDHPRPLDATLPASTGAGELGARAIVQVGYRVVPSLVLSLRGSYGGRTISHAGPGLGAGVTYTW